MVKAKQCVWPLSFCTKSWAITAVPAAQQAGRSEEKITSWKATKRVRIEMKTGDKTRAWKLSTLFESLVWKAVSSICTALPAKVIQPWKSKVSGIRHGNDAKSVAYLSWKQHDETSWGKSSSAAMMKTWAPFKQHKQRWDCVKVNACKLSLFFQQTSVCGTCGQRHSDFRLRLSDKSSTYTSIFPFGP